MCQTKSVIQLSGVLLLAVNLYVSVRGCSPQCMFGLAYDCLTKMCSVCQNQDVIQGWCFQSGCSCNGKNTFCTDVAELCPQSSEVNDSLIALSQGYPVAALNIKTLIVLLHWEKGYGADPSSACWHEQLGLTVYVCLGIHPTSSLKICDDTEAALQHSAVVGQPGAVLQYTESGLLSCTGNLQCALSHLLEILLPKPLQCYTPVKQRTPAVLFKKKNKPLLLPVMLL